MKHLWLRLSISMGCLGLLAVHLAFPSLTFDAVALGLVVASIVPWLSDLIKSLELPSGLKLEFQELRGEVAQQKRELDRLTEFLFSNFVTEAELKHLAALTEQTPYPFKRAWYFDAELRRLRSLGLISGSIGYLPSDGEDLNKHFQITARGRDYIAKRKKIPDEGNA